MLGFIGGKGLGFVWGDRDFRVWWLEGSLRVHLGEGLGFVWGDGDFRVWWPEGRC